MGMGMGMLMGMLWLWVLWYSVMNAGGRDTTSAALLFDAGPVDEWLALLERRAPSNGVWDMRLREGWWKDGLLLLESPSRKPVASLVDAINSWWEEFWCRMQRDQCQCHAVSGLCSSLVLSYTRAVQA